MFLEIIGHDFLYAIENVVRIFYPQTKIETFHKSSGESENMITTVVEGEHLFVRVVLDGFREEHTEKLENTDSRQVKLQLSRVLFTVLQRQTGKTPQWGMLTGVRPISLFTKQHMLGKSDEEIRRYMREVYLAEENKLDLALATMNAQLKTGFTFSEKGFSLYVNIPFCPTRCKYCSFVSSEVGGEMKRLETYLNLLGEEIAHTGRIVSDLGLNLEAVYIGGGTPTVLSQKQLEKLLKQINQSFSVRTGLEYTLEAGRPDTITLEKLETAKALGVNRVSINPQTLNPKALEAIGRNHTVDQFFQAFEMARQVGIPIINTDLIAGLPEETEESFFQGLTRIIALQPENLTLHTLTIKRSADFRRNGEQGRKTPWNWSTILLKGQEQILQSGYHPYYLYRQKGTLDNLENVGFALEGTESRYNIAMMEETETVLGVGAGATTRLWANGNMKRVYNYKFPIEYVKNFSEILLRKQGVRRFYEKD